MRAEFSRVGEPFAVEIHARPSEIAVAAQTAQKLIEEREESATVQRLIDAGLRPPRGTCSQRWTHCLRPTVCAVVRPQQMGQRYEGALAVVMSSAMASNIASVVLTRPAHRLRDRGIELVRAWPPETVGRWWGRPDDAFASTVAQGPIFPTFCAANGGSRRQSAGGSSNRSKRCSCRCW
jgi:hypothetical protein